MRKCTCDSGEWGDEQYDARGIYLTITCPSCHDRKMRVYRPEVLTDPNYEATEDIDP
jgi:cbb3-type cytochrome oxidase cytochrome c subunit